MKAKDYWNPYVAGVVLGLVLLSAYLVAGSGLGATALPKRSLAVMGNAVAPEWTAHNTVLKGYVANGVNPMRNWLVVEVIGVIIGGFIGALSAGRLATKVEKGPNISVKGRLYFAAGGGGIMGFAAALARGCTPGQALSGGAPLAAGSWVFMLMVFAGGYAVARLVRRQWV